MKSKIYLLVFDGLADWEPALILCELNKKDGYEINTVGFSKSIITTMGGIKIIPDRSLAEITTENAKLFIIPGGKIWFDKISPELTEVLNTFNKHNILIGALCAGTLAIAKSGLLTNTY